MFSFLPSLYTALTYQSCKLPGAGSNSFFGFPHWWQYMNGVKDGAGSCVPAFNQLSDFFAVGLAVINILLHIAGMVAVIAIIMAGVNYMAAIGNPEKITGSRKAIQNALIGLAIALIATQVVAFIGQRLNP